MYEQLTDDEMREYETLVSEGMDPITALSQILADRDPSGDDGDE